MSDRRGSREEHVDIDALVAGVPVIFGQPGAHEENGCVDASREKILTESVFSESRMDQEGLVGSPWEVGLMAGAVVVAGLTVDDVEAAGTSG